MKKRISLVLFSLLCSYFATAQTQFETLNYLYSISGKKTLAGQQGEQYWEPMHRITGDYPAMWGEDFAFAPFRNSGTMKKWRELITNEAKQHWAEGAFISLMFHACPPTQAEPCEWYGGVLSHLSDEEWEKLITNGTILNNNWKKRLDAIYPYLQELEDAGVEVFFRPFHEMNQGVFWWAGRKGPNGTAKLFQITRDYLEKTKGLTNLIWVWSVQDFSGLANDLNDYDPGSDYWEVLTLDVYWSDGQGYTTGKYNAMKKKANGKPIAIGECDGLPSPNLLAAQPDWTYFIGWSELTQEKNSDSYISQVYNASNVLTLSEIERDVSISNPDETTIRIYPNPATEQLTIEGLTAEACIRFMDLSGRQLKNIVVKGQNTITLNISDLSKGVYIIGINTTNPQGEIKNQLFKKV
jgi:hypothetical protein